MRNRDLILFFLLFLVSQITAQTVSLKLPVLQVYNASSIYNRHIDVSNAERLEMHIQLSENEELIESFVTTSPFAKHITFKHYKNQKEVLFSGVKLHLYKDGSVMYQVYLSDLHLLDFDPHLPYLLPTVNGLVSVKKSIIEDVAYPKLNYEDRNGQLLFQEDQYRYVKRDTIANAKVFTINPINSANKSYGGSFVDNGDATNTALNEERKWVQMQVRYENGTYYLESDNMFIDDFSAPNDSNNYEQQTADYDYTRDKSFFEAVNAYYHINSLAEYTKSLGYGSLVKKMAVDVHALGGADNSAYDPNNHTLMFGTGGVDDAEDGEVVTHEFTHSLCELASPNTTIGNQRKAIEEGICDYYAKAYSRTFNDNTSNQVFSWDGHNEFWSGIDINTNRIFPRDLKNTKDGDRDMYSSALMCVHDFIGRETTNSILLEHFYYLVPNATMPDMATIMLQIDSANFGKRNYSSLKTCFVAAGFMQHGASVDELSSNDNLTVINSSGFSKGTGNLEIRLPDIANWRIYNVLGQLVTEDKTNHLELNPIDFKSGFYLLTICLLDKTYTLKLVRE
jgi:hypothetical protein